MVEESVVSQIDSSELVSGLRAVQTRVPGGTSRGQFLKPPRPDPTLD
jgi:hypothetical protein